MLVYAIRDLRTDQYSKGGIEPVFGAKKEAKIWTSRGALVRHLLALAKFYMQKPSVPDFSSWYVETYDFGCPKTITKMEEFPLDKLPLSKRRMAELEAGPRLTWHKVLRD